MLLVSIVNVLKISISFPTSILVISHSETFLQHTSGLHLHILIPFAYSDHGCTSGSHLYILIPPLHPDHISTSWSYSPIKTIPTHLDQTNTSRSPPDIQIMPAYPDPTCTSRSYMHIRITSAHCISCLHVQIRPADSDPSHTFRSSHIYPTPPLGQDMTQGSIFKRSLTSLNSEFSFS